MSKSGLILLCTVMFGSYQAKAQDIQQQKIPDEYETTGGHGLGFLNAGVAATTGLASVRSNPAMLAAEKQYRVYAGYHWPTAGREFFNAGAVDSKTSNIAAGVSYTSFSDDYRRPDITNSASRYDSPVIRRGQLAIAQNVGGLAVGIGGHYVEAVTLASTESYQLDKQERVKGMGLSLGVAGLLTPTIRFGLSGENVSNKKIADYAPRTFRGGVAFIFGGGDITAHLDYRLRDRVAHFEGDQKIVNEYNEVEVLRAGESEAEQMAIASFSARVNNYFRLLGAYGQGINTERSSLSGGVAVVSDKLSLSYTAARPYMEQVAAHQAVNLGIEMAF